MTSAESLFTQHGYALLFGAIALETIGFPVPAALALMLAGAAAAQGMLQVAYALSGALLVMLIGDTLMYLLGRYTGWWLLGVMPLVAELRGLRPAVRGFVSSPRPSIVAGRQIHSRHQYDGPAARRQHADALVVVPAPGLCRGVFYIAAYFGIGYAFSGAIEAVTRGYRAVGNVITVAGVALVVGYAALQLWLWWKSRRMGPVSYASPPEAAQAAQTGARIYDVRSHGYFDANALRIKGSSRLDPHAVHRVNADFFDQSQIYLYCTCAREATSKRVARELADSLRGTGVKITVIKGGLRGWRKAGLPLEVVPGDDLVALPTFG